MEYNLMANNKKSSQYNIELKLSEHPENEALRQSFKQALDAEEQQAEKLTKAYETAKKSAKNTLNVEKEFKETVEDKNKLLRKELEILDAKKLAIKTNTQLSDDERKKQLKFISESKIAISQQIRALKTLNPMLEQATKELEKQALIEKEKAEAEERAGEAIEKQIALEKKLLEKTRKFINWKANEEGKLFKLTKAGFSLQEKLNNLLGKESAIRQKISKIASSDLARAGKKVATVGAKGALGAVKGIGKGLGVAGAAIGAIGGIVAGSAGNIAEKENALKSLKSGIDPTIADQVYIKTGADYSTIVSAINNLSKVTKDSGQLVQGAVLEIQNPGIGKMLLSTSMSGTGNLGNLKSHIDQIKKQTGSQDLSQALEASTKSRAVTHGKVTQTEYIQAYAALEAQGLDEETINRVINKAGSQKGDFIENINKIDLSKYAKNSQERVRLSKANLGLEKLNNEQVEKSSAESVQEKMRQLELTKDKILVKLLPIAAKVLDAIPDDVLDTLADVIIQVADALMPILEMLAKQLKPVLESLRPLIDRILIPFLNWLSPKMKAWVEFLTMALNQYIVPAVASILECLGTILTSIPDTLKSYWEGIKSFFSSIWDGIKTTIDGIYNAAVTIGDWVSNQWNKFVEEAKGIWNTIKEWFTEFKNTIINLPSEIGNKIANFLSPFSSNDDDVKPIITGAAAQGGIVNSPTIAGEAGPELILPLDNSRSGRASQIINNFNTNQNFNMTNNQTTPLAFAQAVGMNKFVRRSVI